MPRAWVRDPLLDSALLWCRRGLFPDVEGSLLPAKPGRAGPPGASKAGPPSHHGEHKAQRSLGPEEGLQRQGTGSCPVDQLEAIDERCCGCWAGAFGPMGQSGLVWHRGLLPGPWQAPLCSAPGAELSGSETISRQDERKGDRYIRSTISHVALQTPCQHPWSDRLRAKTLPSDRP